jgi:hypothetical protein
MMVVMHRQRQAGVWAVAVAVAVPLLRGAAARILVWEMVAMEGLEILPLFLELPHLTLAGAGAVV